MPIPFDDLRWDTLTTAYDLPCDEILDWLHTAYSGDLTSDLFGDMINEIQHQGDTSSAMYAVAPHLVALSQVYSGDRGRHLIVHAGLIHASSQSPSAIACPTELISEFQSSALLGRGIILQYLPDASEFDDFKFLIAALAGFMSYGRFGRLIEGIEFFEDQFHHDCLDGPFPDQS